MVKHFRQEAGGISASGKSKEIDAVPWSIVPHQELRCVLVGKIGESCALQLESTMRLFYYNTHGMGI